MLRESYNSRVHASIEKVGIYNLYDLCMVRLPQQALEQ